MPLAPTPYDIVPIPVFPFSPGQREWLLLAVAGGVLLLTARIIPLWFSTRRKDLRAFALARREIAALARAALTNEVTKNQISQASLIIRRLLGALNQADISAMSAAELSEFFSHNSNPQLKETLNLLIEMEGLKYAGCDPAENGKKLLSKAQETLLRYEEEYRQSQAERREVKR